MLEMKFKSEMGVVELELKALQSKCEELQQSNEHATNELINFGNKKAELEELSQHASKKIEELLKKNQTLHARSEKMKQENTKKHKRTEARLNKAIKTLTKQLDGERSRANAIEESSLRFRQNLKNLSNEARELENSYERARAELETQAEEIGELTAMKEKRDFAREAAEKDAGNLKASVEELTNTNLALKKDITALSEELHAQRKAVREIKSEFDAERRELVKAKAAAEKGYKDAEDALSDRLEELRQTNQALKEKESAASDTIDELRRKHNDDYSEKETDIDKLRDFIRSLEDKIEKDGVVYHDIDRKVHKLEKEKSQAEEALKESEAACQDLETAMENQAEANQHLEAQLQPLVNIKDMLSNQQSRFVRVVSKLCMELKALSGRAPETEALQQTQMHAESKRSKDAAGKRNGSSTVQERSSQKDVARALLEFQQELGTVKTAFLELKTTTTALSAKRVGDSDTISVLESTKKSLRDSIADLQSINRSQSEQIDTLSLENADLTTDLENRNRELGRVKTLYQQSKESVQRDQSQFELTMSLLNQHKEELEVRASTVQRSLDEVHGQLQNATQRNKALAIKNGELTTQLEEIKVVNGVHDKTRQELQESVDHFATKTEALETELRHRMEELSHREASFHSIKNECLLLSEANEDLKATVEEQDMSLKQLEAELEETARRLETHRVSESKARTSMEIIREGIAKQLRVLEVMPDVLPPIGSEKDASGNSDMVDDHPDSEEKYGVDSEFNSGRDGGGGTTAATTSGRSKQQWALIPTNQDTTTAIATMTSSEVSFHSNRLGAAIKKLRQDKHDLEWVVRRSEAVRHKAESRNIKLIDDLDSLSVEYRQAKNDFADMAQGHQELQLQLEERSRDLALVERKMESLVASERRISDQALDVEQERSAMALEVQRKKEDVTRMENQVSMLKFQVTEGEEQLKKQSRSFEELKDVMTRRLDQVIEEKLELERRVAHATKELKAKVTFTAKIEEELRYSNNEIVRHEKQCAEYTTAINSAKADLRKEATRVKVLEDVNASLESSHNELKVEKAALIDLTEKQEDAMASIKAKNMELRRCVSNLEADAQTKAQTLRELQEEKKTLNTCLDTSRKQHNQDIAQYKTELSTVARDYTEVQRLQQTRIEQLEEERAVMELDLRSSISGSEDLKSSKEELSAQLHSATEQLSSCKRRLDVLETAYETERTKHAMTDAKSKESESKCVSLEQQVKKLLSSNKLLGEDLGKCSTELAEAKRQLTSYSIIIRDLNDDVDNQSDELQETRAAIDELTIDLKRTNEEYATKLDHSENQLERAVRESTTRISGLEDQLATATEKGVVLESRLDTQQAKYDKSIAQCMERMEEQRNEAEEMIENLNLEKMEMMTAMHEREAEVSKLRDNMDRLKSDLKNEEKRLAESAQHMTDVENDMSKYIKQTESQESIIEQLRETITQLQSAVSSTKHALTERDVTLVNTKHELQEHRREIAELKHTIADHSSTVQSLTQDKQSLEVALDEVRSQHVSVSKQHKHALAQQGDAYAALQETLQARVDTLEHDIEKLHSQVEEKTSKIDQVKATLSSSETKVRSLTEDLNRSKATCADLERQLLSLQTQQKVGKAENNELRQTKAMLENQMKQMRQATRTAEASLSSLQEKLSQAEHRRQKEQKEQKSVFTELQVSLESQITKLQTENLELRKTTTESAQVLHRIKEEKAASQEALISVAAQMETCSARVESLERELQSCKRQGDNDEMALNEMEKTKRRLDDTIKELSRAKDMLEDQIERQAVQVSALTEDKTSLQATVMALEATAEKNAFDRDAMTKTVHKLQQSCDNARSTVAQREQQLALLGEDVKALRQEGVDHFSEKQRFEQENRMLVDRMHQLESDNKVSLQTYQSTIEALQQDKARLESACQERQSQITGMQEKIAVVDNFELTRAKLQDNIRQKEAEVRKLLLEKSEMAQLASRAVSQEETLSKRVHTLERLKQEAMEAMTQSEDRQRELQQAYDSLTQTHGAMLQNKASELAELSTAHQSKLRQLEQKVSATTTELRLEREELQQSHSVLSSRMQELVLLRDEKQKLTTKTTELTRDLQKAQDALRVSEDEYQRAFSTEKTHLTQRAAQAELRVSQLEKRVEDVTAEASVSVQQLQKALSDAHAKQESDQTMLQTYRVKVEESQRLHASDQERSAHQQMQEEELQGKLADSKRRQQRLSDEYTSYKTTMEGKIAQDRDTFNHLQLQVRALEQNAAAAAAVAAEFERQGDEENHVLRLNQERVVTARMELQAYRTASEADIARLKALLLRAQTKLDRSVEMYLAASANDSDDDDDSADAAEVHTRTRMIEQSVGHLVSRQALVSDASRRLRTLKPYLGLDIMADPPHGMKIVGVKKGSPAQASGLLPGDIVQETNSTKTCTGSQFYKILATTRPGDSLSFHLLRYQAEAVSSPSSSSSSSAVSDSPYKFARSHHVTVEVASSTLSFEQVQRLRRISEGIVLCDEQTDDRAFLQALQASKGE